jgi:outer membrane protein assembly factor BamB
MNYRLSSSLAFTLLIFSFSRADNWPEFRGPTGQGLAADGRAPTHWGTSKNVAWKQPIPGHGWSSPIVYEGKVYLTSAVPATGGKPNELSLKAICLDAKNGKSLWQTEVFREPATAPKPHNKNSHASPTPLTDGERLYVHFGHQGTACLDLDGKILWKNDNIGYAPVHGNGGSPILADDALVFSCDGGDVQFVIALDKKSGQPLWKTERKSSGFKKFAFSTPLLITVNGQQQVISPGAHAVCAYEPKTGKEIWRVRYDGYSVIPRPVFGHGLVFLSSGYEAPVLLAIRPDGQGDATDSHVAWQTNKGAPLTPSPLLVGDELYMVSDLGVASCLDAKTGKVHWQQRIGGAFSASPTFADGKIYLQSEDGIGYVLKAGKRYEQLAKNDMNEKTLASYAIVGGAIYLRTATHLYRIQER